jgi:hypothetical protein
LDAADANVAQSQDALSDAETEVGSTLAELGEIEAQKAEIEDGKISALDALTGGRVLSDEAMQELHDLLGMDNRPEPQEGEEVAAVDDGETDDGETDDGETDDGEIDDSEIDDSETENS